MIPASVLTQLSAHVGHEIRVTASGEPVDHMSITCASCDVQIIDAGRQEMEPPAVEIIAVVDDGLIQDVYSSVPARVTRIDIDHESKDLCLVGQFEASPILDFDLEDDVYESFAANVAERFGRAELDRLNSLAGIENEGES